MKKDSLLGYRTQDSRQLDKINVPTLVKWAGGKKQLLFQFKPLFPKKIERYIEPFVGGGAVAFYILTYHPEVKEVILSDVNEELINTYIQVKNNVEDLIIKLKEHKKYHTENGKNYYLRIRATKPIELTPLSRAARFIYSIFSNFKEFFIKFYTYKISIKFFSYNSSST